MIVRLIAQSYQKVSCCACYKRIQLESSSLLLSFMLTMAVALHTHSHGLAEVQVGMDIQLV